MDPITIAMALSQFVPSLLKLFGASAPTVATANKVIGVAQAVTGATTPEDALAALKANTEQQNTFAQAMGQQQNDITVAMLNDVKDARARDAEFIKAGKTNTRADIMVGMDVFGLISCLIVLVVFHSAIPGEAVGLISTIASFFGLSLRDAHQFEFGSSRSSQTKDTTISNLTK